MKCVIICALLLITWTVESREINYKQELKALAEQIEQMKSLHLADVTKMKKEIDELKQNSVMICTDNHERNEKETLEWAKNSMKELRTEMRELSRNVNSSMLLQQLHTIRNELKRALSEAKDLTRSARTQEARVDKLDSEVGHLKMEDQQLRAMTAHFRSHIGKLAKELKAKLLDDYYPNSYNEVLEPNEIREGKLQPQRGHKYRHNKMVHAQISRLARSQDQLDEYQQNLQAQMLDIQKRLDHVEEPNWNLITAKVDFLQMETKSLKNQLKNMSQKFSDFDKVHASMLELREDVESIENKADKTIPEFRKEISKLDVSFAQLNAQSSYLKEDQEHLRQSVKAIAVSVSNAIDRAEMDRLVIKKINDSIDDLEIRSKQHYYRLNDHILKSETSNVKKEANESNILELMNEVKELQPIEREYEDLIGQLPKDCTTVSGPADKYLIHPGNNPVETWCANGTTLIQRRFNGTVEFNRNYSEYVHGFGDPGSEFWLGLESMYHLTSDNCSSMRIDMSDIYGSNWYAEYEFFVIGSSDTGYVLNVGGYKGNASDAFEYQNRMEFSTIDHDRDISNTHCAANYEGGWWFSHCQHVNINGKYNLGLTWFDSGRNEWIAVSSSEMRMYRRPGCV